MFAGVDKLGGGVVGNVITDSKVSMITMGESAATASAEETLVGKAMAEDGSSEDVLLRSRVDPTSGGLCWLPVDATIAAQDTTAMSQMTSMLHDADRNRKYEEAITNAVEAFRREHGRPPVVLDIGCGTGLLSMLAVKTGAEEVYGCELYEPLAKIAREVTELNCQGKIKIIAKRSTDLRVGQGEDIPQRVDMCVNEIYDSALLGEGCLPAFRHALANLLVDSPVMVPSGADVHGVLLNSPSLRARHDLSEAVFSEGVPVARNARAADCKGGRKALPLQGAEVEDATRLSAPFHALSFDFMESFPEEGCRSRKVSVPVEGDGVLDAIMLTWDLALHGEVSYSTRPGAENWQDHWCPSYFPVVGQVEVRAGDTVHLKSTHSELNIIFEVLGVDRHVDQLQKDAEMTTVSSDAKNSCAGEKYSTANPAASLKRSRSPGAPKERSADSVVNGHSTVAEGCVGMKSTDSENYRMEREWDPEPCGCGWHVLCNPERIGMLKDSSRREVYRQAIARLLRGHPTTATGASGVCLDIGDGATCAFLAAGEGASAAVSFEPAEWSHLLVGQVVRNNDLEDRIHLLESADEWPFLKELVLKEGTHEAEEGQQEHLLCDILMGEPFYYRMQSLVLYEAVNFWYLRRLFHPALKSSVRVLPLRAIVCVAGVELPELSLSHGPVEPVRGFDHSPYNEIVRSRWHKVLYPYPLRAYKHRLLTEPKDLLSLDYSSLPTDVEATTTISPAHTAGTLHAVAIWVDYQLDESTRWSTFGGMIRPGGNEGPPGGVHEKQMLRFLPKPVEVMGSVDGGSANLKISGRFDVEGGDMSFDVSVVE